jgi:hypothetical protein
MIWMVWLEPFSTHRKIPLGSAAAAGAVSRLRVAAAAAASAEISTGTLVQYLELAFTRNPSLNVRTCTAGARCCPTRQAADPISPRAKSRYLSREFEGKKESCDPFTRDRELCDVLP